MKGRRLGWIVLWRGHPQRLRPDGLLDEAFVAFASSNANGRLGATVFPSRADAERAARDNTQGGWGGEWTFCPVDEPPREF